MLLIDASEIKGVSIGGRPKMASGSSGPRVFLAMHMALLDVNDKYGSGVRFPFIIDTPRQQDLDLENTTKLLNTIFTNTKSHQIFVANGEIPEGWVDSEERRILTFETKRLVLRDEDYAKGVLTLSTMVADMRDAIRLERESAVSSTELSEIEDDEASVPVEDEADDDAE